MATTSLPAFGDEPPIPATEPRPTQSDTGKDNFVAPDSREVRLSNLGGANTPIVMMFGPSNAGKTVALSRLAKYFKDTLGDVVVDRTFRTDEYYQKSLCKKYDEFLESIDPNRPINTPDADFLAINFNERGQTKGPICKFIELPGESLYKVDTPLANQPFPLYLRQIFNHPARKIIVFTVPLPDPQTDAAGAMRDEQFDRFCARIRMVISFNPGLKRDSYIFAVTKADEQVSLVQGAVVANRAAFRDALISRPGFDNVVKALKDARHRLVVVPFSAGQMVPTVNGQTALAVGDNAWPKMLWGEIRNAITGRGFWAELRRMFGLA